jgi:hypothetical protein
MVGGPDDNGGDGSAWVFTLSGGVWTQQMHLPATIMGGNEQYGYSVALSANGNSAIVGTPRNDNGAGGAWALYRTSDGSWLYAGPRMIPTDSAGVVVSGDGNMAILGGPFDNNYLGAAFVFIHHP